MTALIRGARLGPYELLVPLGKGGMATVWIGRRFGVEGQQFVALKAMLPELARDSDFRAMFLEEGQIVRSIEHENVVKVHGVGEEQGILYMAMDWVEGDSLRTLIREAQKRRPIPPEIAVKLIADAAAGLHAAHELRGWDGELRNLVHCDVSPHNILVGVDGRARIADFGVANATHHASFGIEARVRGKCGYMSPEQAEGRAIDRRSDVFSLGSVLFELTTGERLFRGESSAHTLSLVLSAPIPDPRQILPDYPERLAHITRRALARDPRERFQSADALRAALEQYLVEERIVVSQSSVAKLVERVLGERIVALRSSVERACRASPTSDEDTGTPRPASFEALAPRKSSRRSALAPLLSAIGGITAATASILWVTAQRPGSRDLTPSTSGSPLAAGQPTLPHESGPSGVDVQSIPLGAAPRATSATGAVPNPGKANSVYSAHPPARVAPSPVRPPSVTKQAAPNLAVALPAAPSARPAASALPVELEETPTPPMAATSGTKEASPLPTDPAPHELQAFNRGAALATLNAASQRASGCSLPQGVSGSGRASVTFSPDGRVAKVSLNAPFDGTMTGQCVASALRSARVPPFTGSPVTLPATFRVK